MIKILKRNIKTVQSLFSPFYYEKSEKHTFCVTKRNLYYNSIFPAVLIDQIYAIKNNCLDFADKKSKFGT